MQVVCGERGGSARVTEGSKYAKLLGVNPEMIVNVTLVASCTLLYVNIRTGTRDHPYCVS